MNKLVIAKPGKNAKTSTDPDDFIFHSDYNTLKYFMSGNTSISITGNGATQYSQVVVAHNLGYIPFFICLVNAGSAYFFAPRSEQTIAPHTLLYGNAYADDTNLYLTLKTDFSNPNIASMQYTYKIFKNNLGL